MIVCPNCNHQNPDGAVQCEACYTPLPAMTTCPNCQAIVQADASFCGQCGFNLRTAKAGGLPPTAIPGGNASQVAPSFAIPDLPPPEPPIQPEPLMVNPPDPVPSPEPFPPPEPFPALPDPLPPPPELAAPPAAPDPLPIAQAPPPLAGTPVGSQTQLQVMSARLLHVQTNTTVELPPHLSVVHIGKPNDRIPPDVDVSGYPDSEIVSRIHADIRVESDAYYLEDVGSSNGTYVNNVPLPMGNRHRLRSGDRVSLGKGDRVTFLFQSS